jgi:hypothetical protein
VTVVAPEKVVEIERRAAVGANGNRPPKRPDGYFTDAEWARYEQIRAEGRYEAPFTTPLVFHTLAELIDIVANRPTPKFLASPIWPGDAYGVLGGEMKAGKTWLVCDFMVTTASGGAWLGKFPIERQGPVLAFLGEGGERKMVRRLAAVAQFYNVDLPCMISTTIKCLRSSCSQIRSAIPTACRASAAVSRSGGRRSGNVPLGTMKPLPLSCST